MDLTMQMDMEREYFSREFQRKLGCQLPLGEILHLLRQRPFKSLSLEEVSEMTSIPVKTVLSYERSDAFPDIAGDHLLKLSMVYEIPVEILEDYCTASINRKKWLGEL